MKARWIAVLFLLAAVAYGLGMAASAETPCTITVRPGESIQAAIDSASPGDVICLAEGTWKENVMIEKSLTLRGAGREKSIIKGKNWHEPVILTWSDREIEVLIEGLTVAEAKVGEKMTYKEDGIRIGGRATVTIRNSKISENDGDGIWMGGSSQTTISGSEISGNLRGIWMGDSSQATISDSKISGNRGGDGIRMEGSSQATISDSEISGNLHGIGMEGSAQATISGSKISGNGLDGIWMGGSSQATISGSKISGNRHGIGIWMGDSSQATISGSKISGNGWYGIWMGYSSQATISDSQISENRYDGIHMGYSSQATIRDNEIFENKRYGVALYQQPCFDTDYKFEGKVEGSGNEIHDNGKGNVCPSELGFLMTSSGGCYGPLCE